MTDTSTSCLHHLERLAHRLEPRRLLALQLRLDLLEPPDRLLGIEPLTASEADLGPHLQDGGVGAASEKLLHLLLHQLPPREGAFIEGFHPTSPPIRFRI